MLTDQNTIFTPSYSLEAQASYKCEICLLAFNSVADRNVHCLEHFPKINCTVCHQYVIQIGNIWYSPHEHDFIKTEANTEESTEHMPESVLLPNYIDVKPLAIISPDSESIVFGINDTAAELDPIYSGNNTTKLEFMDTEDNETSIELVRENNAQNARRNYCTICNKDFKASNNYRYHMNIHLGVKPFKCKECNTSYADKRNLIKHIQSQRHKNWLQRNMKRWKKYSSAERRLKCKICLLDLESEHNLMEHIQACHADISVDESFGNIIDDLQNSLKEEDISSTSVANIGMKTAMPRRKKIVCSCDICKKEFTSTTNLKYHMNIHLDIKPFACDECSKAYADKRNLVTHLRVSKHVTKMEKFRAPKRANNCDKEAITCNICKKEFACKPSLEYHMNIHNSLKPYACKCGKAYSDKRNLYTHKKGCAALILDEDSDSDPEISVPLNVTQAAVDWVCEYCNEDFELEIRLTRHVMKKHSDDMPEHVCNICAQEFSQPKDLLAHMRAHPESTQHKCSFDGCGQGFASEPSLRVHAAKHNRINGSIQRKTQDQLTDLKLQVAQAHSSNRLQCSINGCNRVLKTSAGMAIHLRKFHPESIWTCDICDKVFYSEETLAKHRINHDKREDTTFPCTVCGKTFLNKFTLRSHFSKHETILVCELCGKKFSSRRTMLAHRKQHEVNAVSTCKFKDCNKTFSTSEELQAHVETHPTKDKKAICNYCGGCFSSLTYLKDHINMHTGHRPYKCKECGKSFARDGLLRSHMLIHSGEKPYVCDIDGCTAAYKDAIYLTRHKFSAH